MADKIVEGALVQFNLPFAINLPNDIYTVKSPSYYCRVKLELKISQENPSGWTGGARISEDRFGHTNYSRIAVEFIFDNPEEFSIQLNETLKLYAIDAVNRILDACRWASDEFFNRDVVLKDIGSITVKLVDKSKKEVPGSEFHIPSRMSFGQEGPVTGDEIKRIKEILQNGEEFPLDIELQKNAKDYLLYENYRLTCIDIQSAVELIMSQVIRKNLEGKGEKDAEIEKILNSRLDDLLRPYLVDATESGILQTQEYQNWRVDCYKLRNDVVHKSKIPTPGEATKAFEKGTGFIDYLKKFS